MPTLPLLGVTAATPLVRTAPVRAGASDEPPYYMTLGNPVAVGAQPIEADPLGTEGYVDRLYTKLRRDRPDLRLAKLGCIGERLRSVIEGSLLPPAPSCGPPSFYASGYDAPVSAPSARVKQATPPWTAEGQRVWQRTRTAGRSSVPDDHRRLQEGISFCLERNALPGSCRMRAALIYSMAKSPGHPDARIKTLTVHSSAASAIVIAPGGVESEVEQPSRRQMEDRRPLSQTSGVHSPRLEPLTTTRERDHETSPQRHPRRRANRRHAPRSPHAAAQRSQPASRDLSAPPCSVLAVGRR